jgi:dienelactone hydrolase
LGCPGSKGRQPDQAESATVSSPQGNGSIKGYLVRPANATGIAGVLVVHENRGLNPYIEDVARRLAIANFIAFAPDGLTWVGGYPGDEKGAQLFAQVDNAKMREDFLAAATWLKSRPDSTGKLGAVGFCFGGSVVNQLAVRMGPDLAAAVPFYGGQPSADDAAKIKAPVLAQYGETRHTHHFGMACFLMSHSRQHMCRTKALFTWAPITASIMTRLPVTTTQRPNLHGSGRLSGSTST